MAKTHYEVLGVTRSASAEQIRSAYRKLALKHHPDQSKDPASKAIFLAATESYEVLSNPDARKQYDDRLSRTARAQASPKSPGPPTAQRASTPSPPRPAATKPGPTRAAADTGGAAPKVASIAEEIQRLTKLYQGGRHNEAEAKAHEILKRDSRQSMPYAILGDIARARGNVNEAARMYAYAMQMDPRNVLYERRYREILDRSRVVDDDRKKTRLEPADRKVIVPMIGGFIVVLMAIYLVLSQEQPVLRSFGPVSTWTFTSLVTLFVSGITVGASLSIGNVVERYGEVSVTSTGRFSPTAALGCVSIIQFWLAALLYAAVGLVHRSWNFSITRLVVSVGAATVTMSFAACLNVNLDPRQIFVWGGNLVYLGALCGWIVADAFR